jgi:hypothetical protein
MANLADDVFASRRVRNAARDAFDSRRSRIRQDLDARGVGGRIADKLGADAVSAYEEAVAIAEQNKGIVAGTITALVVWFLRNPLLALLDSLGSERTDEAEPYDDEDIDSD